MLRTDLHIHYDQMWEEALSLYQVGQFRYDPWLDQKNDDRYGLTLLYRPDDSVKNEIQFFLQNIQSSFPEQYFYPSSDIHLTVMSVISCYSGFTLDQIHLPEYIDLLKDCLSNYTSFRIHYKGITAANAGVMIQGFPEGDLLNDIRDELRGAFKNSSLENSLDKRYKLTTAHMTVMRFRKNITQPGHLIKALQPYRQYDFGMTQIEELELVFNDWYQRKEKVRLMHRFSL